VSAKGGFDGTGIRGGAPIKTARIPDAPAPAIRFAGGRISTRISPRAVVVVTIIMLFVLGLALFAVTLGEYPISLDQIFAAFSGDGSDGVRRIVLEWRLPRILLAVIAGAALGLSGAVFQSVTRNPLGSPDIIGFTSGAYTGALVVLLVVRGNYIATSIGALVGGIVTAAVVYALSYRGGIQGYRLIVIGIASSFFLQAVNGWLIISTDDKSALAAASWGAGSFNLVGWREVITVASVMIAVIPVLVVYGRRLKILEMGDDAAVGLGVRAETTRGTVLVIGVVLVAVVTAAVGPVAFIALAAPQIARRITGSAGVALLPAAAMGAALTLASDVVAQRLVAPSQLPVGVVTVVLGGVYFVALLITQSRKS
jgi:iron complex transport system permease protein